MAARPVITPGLDPNDPADVWLDSLDVSHIKPLDDDWENHPYWADQDDLENDESDLAAAAREMAIEDSPEEKAEDCKVHHPSLTRFLHSIRSVDCSASKSAAQALHVCQCCLIDAWYSISSTGSSSRC